MTSERVHPRCLDITRLISRSGRVLTGVDRVEYAYLAEFLTRDDPVWFLARLASGYAILDRSGGAAIKARLDGAEPWGRLDLAGLLSRRLTPQRRRAEADIRRHALARCLRAGLSSRLRQVLPPGTQYFNVGHSNLSQRVLTAWRAVRDARVAVLIHDTIPLDYPQFQRPESVARFAAMLARVRAGADIVIANSQATRDDLGRHWAQMDAPSIRVAPLGVDLPPAAPLRRPIPTDRPYFVILGTIEPRKNHALLLDAWDAMRADPSAAPVPRLVIAGSRGWRNEDVFRRLDAEATGDGLVLERPDLTDGELVTVLQGSAGLLFPSRAEGFGLPAVEAAKLGVRVLASNLSVFEEILGDYCVYGPPDDVYFWEQRIIAWTRSSGVDRRKFKHRGISGSLTWGSHFDIALTPV